MREFAFGHLQSPHRYVESEVTIHYRSPVRAEAKEALPEEELARRQAEAMRRIYQEERRRKYLQELQDMQSRRHTDNFTYRALYNYRPQNEDELELVEGDTVYVMEKCDDGWYVGSSQRTGFFGTFPGNYVERL
ncbi:LIM and SH3 domain protein Lasp [Gryllus bimaculatus]|nr:LIM and SH3 domain protein Lasp [Gryllus bimaculatus]